ncbi:MAG: mechanosensitive ion channel family protein [Bacteroidales bacterium]|nr:mechanosensitive ion channel family protein [Bacteroidales bacterium]
MKELLNIDNELISNILAQFNKWVAESLPAILVAIIVFIIALKSINLLEKKIRKTVEKRKLEKEETEDTGEYDKRINTLIGIFKGAAKITLWIILIMILLKHFGINIGPLLAGAGIVGLAIGFGAQELVRDIISGFFLLLENQVRTGDVAIINGTGGLVEKIELRTVTLRDFSGVVHIIQNGKINTMSNMTKEWSAMVFDVGVAYKEDTEQVMKIMKEVGDELKKDPEFGNHIIEPIEVFGLDKFGDSAIIIKARLKTKPIQQWTIGREYRKRLKKAFDEQNIEIPFPHTTVYWGEEINPLQLTIKEQQKQ